MINAVWYFQNYKYKQLQMKKVDKYLFLIGSDGTVALMSVFSVATVSQSRQCPRRSTNLCWCVF